MLEAPVAVRRKRILSLTICTWNILLYMWISFWEADNTVYLLLCFFFNRCLECDLVFSEPSRIPIRRRQTIFIILIMYGRVFPICRMRNGLALCARRLAIRFRWTGRKQRRKSLPLHFAPCLLPFFKIVSNPLLSLICMSAERKREEHSRLRRTRRDGQADDGIGGARRTQLTARLVWHFTWSLRSLSLSVQCSSSSSCFNS